MEIERILLSPSEWVPNNPLLPVILYRGALDTTTRADGFERLFARNGWQGIWRDGIYGYHHYHVTAHESLGVARGEVDLTIGGPGGVEITLFAGDAVVLPTGTGHRNLRSSPDFAVVGAYPRDQYPDIQISEATAAQLDMIARVAIPESDPVQGMVGYLQAAWAIERKF